MIVLCVYVFLIYSRLPEVIGSFVGALHLAMILMAILACSCFINGVLPKTFLSFPGMTQLAFTVWMFVCIPMSVWPGGSFHTDVFEWLPAFVTFFVTAGLISTVKDSERLTRSMAFGVVAILVTYILFGSHAGGRSDASIGTMGNPNLFALQLLMGMPFCLYAVYRSGIMSLKGAASAALLLATTYLVVSTGSRSGLIAMAVGMLILLIRSSVLGKFGLILMACVALVGALVVLPRTTLDRYRTLFSDDPDLAAQDSDVISARDSATARRYHLQQSITLTFQHPLFGVGPGQFRVAAADLSEKKHEHAAWLETHNSWTQVSSETGFPGIVFYLGGALVCIKRLWSQYRVTRKNPQLSNISDMTFCLLLSFVVTIVTMTFASVAYQPYLPLLCGLAVGLLLVSERAIKEANLAPNAVPVQPLFPPAWKKRVIPVPHTPALRGPGNPHSF
jgi:O-antigen ligase